LEEESALTVSLFCEDGLSLDGCEEETSVADEFAGDAVSCGAAAFLA
jgi:hypothetical protein